MHHFCFGFLYLLHKQLFFFIYPQGAAAAGPRPAETRRSGLEGDPRRRGSDQLGPGTELHGRPEQRDSAQSWHGAELHPRALLSYEDHYHRQDVCHRTHRGSEAELHHGAHSHQPHHPEVLSYL